MKGFKFIKNKYLDFWNLLFIFILIFYSFQHSYFSAIHFHEGDSSSLFEFMKDDSTNESMKSFIREVTPDFLLHFRLKISELSQYIPFKPLKKFIQLPYLSTYPALMGFIYSKITISSYESFYRIASFITGLALQISSLLLYITCIRVNYSKRVGFIISSLLLTFYGTNSYSYHLGSTIWYIFSISVGIFLLTFEKSFGKDLISSYSALLCIRS